MLVKLKGTLARRPLAGFLVLVGSACIVYAGLASAWSSTPVWTNRFSTVSAMAAGLAALVCCWATSGPSDRPPRRLTQLCIVVAVVLVTVAGLCLRIWMAWRVDRGIFARTPDLNGVSMPPLGGWIHRELGTTVSWLRALVAGLVLAGALSPFAAVRRTARALVSWRGLRVWRLTGLAVVVPAICTVIAALGGRLAPVLESGSIRYGHPVAYPLAYFVTALVLSVPLVFAWYGFVDRRLAHLVSPLVSGMVIGLALVLPYQLVMRIADRSIGLSGLNNAWIDLTLASQIAVAVMAVWFARRARGSLVPTAVLLAAVSTEMSFSAMWFSASVETTQQLYAAFLIGAAVLFAITGRMWRVTGARGTPEPPDGPDAASEPSVVGTTLQL